MDIFSFLIAVWLTQSARQVLNAQGCVQTSSKVNPSLNKAKAESSAGHWECVIYEDLAREQTCDQNMAGTDAPLDAI
jgi:hypothetical protein